MCCKTFKTVNTVRFFIVVFRIKIIKRSSLFSVTVTCIDECSNMVSSYACLVTLSVVNTAMSSTNLSTVMNSKLTALSVKMIQHMSLKSFIKIK